VNKRQLILPAQGRKSGVSVWVKRAWRHCVVTGITGGRAAFRIIFMNTEGLCRNPRKRIPRPISLSQMSCPGKQAVWQLPAVQMSEKRGPRIPLQIF